MKETDEMTSPLPRMALYAVVLLFGAFSVLGVGAPVAAQDDTCYPVPPGGCPEPGETETPDPEPEPEPTPTPEPEPEPGVTCEDVIAAITGGIEAIDADGDGVIDNPALDVNGDGFVNAADLPETCGCPELQELVNSGALDEEGMQQLVDQGIVDEQGNLTGECAPAGDEEPDEEVPAEMAQGGIDATGLAGMVLAAMLAGVAMLAVARRRA